MGTQEELKNKKEVEEQLKKIWQSDPIPGKDSERYHKQILSDIPDSDPKVSADNMRAYGNLMKDLSQLKALNRPPFDDSKRQEIQTLQDKMNAIVNSHEMGVDLGKAVGRVIAEHSPDVLNGLPPGASGAIIGGIAQSNPNQTWAQNALGQNLMQQGQPAQALAAFNHSLQIAPNDVQALTGRSGAQLDLQNFTGASADAKSALQLDPNNKEALAVLHFSAGRIDGAAPSGPSGAAEKGAGAAAASSGAGAASGGGFGGMARSGAGAFGSSSSGGLTLGASTGGANARLSGEQAQKAAQGALAMNDFGGALAFINRGLAPNPGDPGLLNMRSSIFARQHDYAQAAADAKAGLASAPKDPALLRSLGFAQLRGKDYQGASATANEMIELNPADPYAYAIRGHSYGSMGDRDAMMSDLSRAAELDPSFAPAAAKMASQAQLPSDKDMLFLFPGEEGAAPATAPAAGRARNFGALVGASALGGLLLALGLLSTVLAPLKEKLTSAFTRVSRTGPTIDAAAENEEAEPASADGFMPGLIRGQYEISRQIGMGGMGMVFAGTDRSLGRPVAIKKMREELRVNPQERARFVIEAKTVAALHHPNIVDIYAIAEDGADVFLIFEYVDGRTVHEVVQRSGRLAIADAARIVRGAADALAYAHSRGVVHRDMKPSNMMIDGSGSVKVMDFGIARMAKDAMTRYSMTNSVVGTPPYMAPEQEQGQVRRESDVYALAVCAYEMMTGKLPFIGIGAGMLMNKINMSYVAPSRAIAGLPETLDEVFAKAFQADPDKRWRTPKEFADALVSALPASVRA
jgi:tetratricopeptide (TPR) repeat protein